MARFDPERSGRAADRGPGPAGPQGGVRRVLLGWLAVTTVAETVIGTVVTAAVLAVVGQNDETPADVVGAAVGVLIIYWLTHSYADAMEQSLDNVQHHLGRQLLLSVRSEAVVLAGGLPALLMFALASAFGATLDVAVNLALWLSAVLLFALGWTIGRLQRLTGLRLVGEAALAGGVGAIIVLLKTFVHH
ncbi:MAG: hypothetical protein ACXVXC_12265 [Nocardioidaceae bacterium]